MKTIITIHLISLVLSVNGNLKSSLLNTSNHRIHIEENSIIRVVKIGESDRLSMIYRTPYVIIGPNAFNNSGVKTLHLSFDPSANLMKNYGTISLQSKSFDDLDLDSLSFKRAQINFNSDALVPIRSLNHLSLEDCNLAEVPTILLMVFPNLESLILSHNNMNILHHNAFDSLKRLWYLDLSSNNITTLEFGCFNGLEELDKLNLSNNSFITLPPVFKGLPKLTELHMRDCRVLQEIDDHAFRDTPTLTALTLTHTGVHTLKPGMFDHLPRLRWLQLDKSHISRIPKGVFNKLESLQYLFLDYNDIVKIESDAFSGLNLRYLGLSYQNIGFTKGYHVQRLVIEKGAFNGSSIDIIYMVGTSNFDIKLGAFDGLIAEKVDLHCGGMRKIETGIFSGLKTRKLDLSSNRISDIGVNAFKNVVVEEIDMSFNFIKTVDNIYWGLSESMVVRI